MRLTLLGLIIAAAIAFAGRKKDEAPPAAPPPTETPVEAPATATPASPAPKLFPTLPVAVVELPDGLPNLSAQSCNACHWQAHDDWADSAHARAWRDPVFQAAVSRAGNATACRGCHLAMANQHAWLATGYLEGDVTRPNLSPNPAWDATLMSEGVTCATCHVREGTVLGTHANDKAPHPVVVSEELGQPELCATCHQLTWPGADQPFYDTYGEWKASAYAAAGVRCQDCHMPPRAGLATATRFAASPSHSFTADERRALSVLLQPERGEVQRGQPWKFRLRVQNTGAGHHVPTGSPFKSVVIEVALLDAAGKALATPLQHTLARKVEDAPPWRTLTDSRLAAGSQLDIDHVFLVDQKKKAGSATLRVSLVQPDRPAETVVLQEIPLNVL